MHGCFSRAWRVFETQMGTEIWLFQSPHGFAGFTSSGDLFLGPAGRQPPPANPFSKILQLEVGPKAGKKKVLTLSPPETFI